MSFDRRATRLVAGRELREALRRKTAWFAVGVAFVGSLALMVLPELIGGSSNHRKLAVTGTPTPELTAAVQRVGRALDLRIVVSNLPSADAVRDAVKSDEIDAGLVLVDGQAGATGDGAEIITDDAGSQLVAVVRQALATERSVARLRAAGLDDQAITSALSSPVLRVTEVDPDRGGRIAAASVASLFVYLLLIMLTTQVANGVAIEKANRVSEVLLPIVPSHALLLGKVMAVSLLGMMPFVAGALPVLVKLVAGSGLPPGIGAVVAGSGAWLLLGAAFYLLVAGALGALVERPEDAGSSIASLSVLLVGSYLIGQAAADSPVGAVMALLPFSSPIVEPARLALGVSSPAEVIGSLSISVLAVALVGRVAGRVYGRAVVRTGRRLKLRDVLRRPAT